jgi:hypothetical protein
VCSQGAGSNRSTRLAEPGRARSPQLQP